MKRPGWKIAAAFITPLAVGLLLMKRGGLLERTNSAQTTPDHPDSLLRTRRIERDLKTVGITVQSTLGGLKSYGRSWKTTQIQRDNQAIVFTVEVTVLMFTDDLSVTLQRQGKHTLCDVRSAARVGQGDLGENRRHIRQLLHALDAQRLEDRG